MYNVTLRGGIKSGNFTDKGVVKHMDECSAFCCAHETCNVAFLIRDNCFLVACKDYDSCQVKPALSEYYHPRLTYVNWSPPDDEIPGNSFIFALFFFNKRFLPKIVAMSVLPSSLLSLYPKLKRRKATKSRSDRKPTKAVSSVFRSSSVKAGCIRRLRCKYF